MSWLYHTQDIYIGPQGAATLISLSLELQECFQVQDLTPHAINLGAEEHRARELGPMVKSAMQVPELDHISNKYIHISPDKQYISKPSRVYDKGIAEFC